MLCGFAQSGSQPEGSKGNDRQCECREQGLVQQPFWTRHTGYLHDNIRNVFLALVVDADEARKLFVEVGIPAANGFDGGRLC